MTRIDRHNPMVSKKEVIELCDMLLMQGRGKKKALEFIKERMAYIEDKDNIRHS